MSRSRALFVALAVCLASTGASLAAPGSAWSAPSDHSTATVIVRGAGALPVAAVRRAGGTVSRTLSIIDAVVADVPRSALSSLAGDATVESITPNAPMRLLSEDSTSAAEPVPASMADVADTVRARALWSNGALGTGVDVALIDSGVVPVDGLRAPGKVVNGPDLSFESGNDAVQHLDTHGHGTHMAGIIAGRDDAIPATARSWSSSSFAGIAPGARLVNLKVADAAGATDVSQVIAAIDWVVQHRHGNGLNIRVLNLSFGTDGLQTYELDPLAYAVEQAWHAGIVVVVAAGNEGYGDEQLNNPAYDPYVLAVGGSDWRGTSSVGDDVLGEWSSRGSDARRPDVVAPGQSVLSLRDPGSYLDVAHPQARSGERLFRGSGTSQAAAVVSGAAALLLSHRPDLTPDQVKGLLRSTAVPLSAGEGEGQGRGSIDVRAASAAHPPTAAQSWARARGIGSIQAARGSSSVSLNGVPVVGEMSVFYTVWSGYGTTSGLIPATWSGGGWTGNSWTGNSWSGGTWMGNSWTGNSWTGNSWTGNSWTGNSWTGNSWTGNSWTGNSWSSRQW